MIWAVIPAKGYGRAKSRLAGVMTPHQRHRLARQLFLHVASTSAEVVDRVAVLTDSPEVAADAYALGALVLPDRRQGLAAVIDDGLASLQGDRALVLMADLPDVTVAALRRLMRHPSAAVPDHHGTHTNALWTTLPAPPTCFGPDSLARHARRFPIVPVPALSLDIDVPADLRRDRPGA